MKLVIALSAAALLTACAPTMAAAPAGAFQAPSRVAVTLDHSWTHIPPALNLATNGSVLTRHGLALERVDIISIEPGEAIVRARENDDAPRFRDGMSEIEVVELVTSSLARMGYTDVQTTDVRPHQWGGANGVRFGLNGRYPSGLNLRGDVVLAQANGKLNLMMYLAPASHYYDATATDFEHMVASAQLS